MEENNTAIEDNIGKTPVSNRKKEFFSNLRTIVITIIISLLFIYFVAQLTVVHGTSMMPTLHDRDWCAMEKLSTRFGHPKRNDVVVLHSHVKGKEFYIKRVIGLPGETVYISPEGNIFIDGALYEDEYGAEVMIDPGLAADGITLEADEYFVLGDNRNNSNDSRFFGPVKKKDLTGHVFLDLAPGRNPYKKVENK